MSLCPLYSACVGIIDIKYLRRLFYFFYLLQQFKRCPLDDFFKKTRTNGEVHYDIDGPWCDIWSMGVMLLMMVLGRGNAVSEVQCHIHASYVASCLHNIHTYTTHM